MNTGNLYIIVPVYNESRSIYDLLGIYTQVLPGLGLFHQLLVIYDCSQDDSPYWIDRAACGCAALNLECLRHKPNKGLHGVLNTSLGWLAGCLGENNLLVTMDGDNAHNPWLIPDIMRKVRQGADIIVASLYCEGSRIYGLTRGRRVLSYVAGWLYWLSWRLSGVKDYTFLYRMYRGAVLLPLLHESGPSYLRQLGFTCSSELLRRVAGPATACFEVPIILRYANKMGASNMRVLRTVLKTLRMLEQK